MDGPAGILSYAELDAQANRLARFLQARGDVGPGDRVGLLFDRAVDGYVGMLAVLKLHAAYVPLDVGFPADRVSYIAADAQLRVVLSHSDLTPVLAQLDQVRSLCLDEFAHELAGQSAARLAPGDDPPDELCYIIYTSGTTGRPKGVAINHRSICNFVRVACEVYGVRGDDRMYQGLPIAFDFAFEEIWVAWLAGATLVPKHAHGNLLGPELHDFLTANRVTALCCVPTLLSTLEQDLPELRFLLVSGESCPHDLVLRWSGPGRRMLNVYGPTEATVSATWAVLDADRPVTIGVPLPTYSVVILDPDDDRTFPHGEAGELGIAGIGLADGYLNDEDRTRRAFIPDFLSIPGNTSARIYRSGDLARVNSTGDIEHLGRIDTQIKIRGYRVELEEIETVLRQAPGVGGAVVGSHLSAGGLQELVGYITPAIGEGAVDPEDVYALLRERLPAYMVPAYLEELDELPLMVSGKVDRSRLRAPTGPRWVGRAEEYVEPATSLEGSLADALATVLGVDRVSVDGNFFDDLGGSSLLMARFNAELRGRGDLPAVSIRDVYLHPTVRRLAEAVQAREAHPSETAVPASGHLRLPEATGTPRYALCGALQLLAFMIYACLTAVALDDASSWLTGGQGWLGVYLRAVAVGGGLILGAGLLPIAAKWVLIGRWKPQRIRIWSLGYVRFWIVKTLVVANPLARLMAGTPLYGYYLRALGAKVGKGAVIFTRHVPVCTDLLSIGAGCVIRKDTYLNCYRARAGVIEIGPVTLGEDVLIGEHSVLDIDTVLETGVQLGHASSVQAGQRLPAGACWHGSPAEPAAEGYDYRTLAPAVCTSLRRATYSAMGLLSLFAVVAPLAATTETLLLTHPQVLRHASFAYLPLVAVGIVGSLLLLGLVVAASVPRLLTRALKPGQVYPLFGLHYTLHRLIARTSNIPSLTALFGDSSAIVGYLRILGYRLGVVEQTGSNFGTAVRHEVPALCHVGTGTMVSDGLSMMNAELSNTSFQVLPVVIGERNFLGNGIVFPAGARTADNCLLATKAMIPVGGPPRQNVGLLGSPCFEIPRSTDADPELLRLARSPERERRLAAKARHNAVTMALHLLVRCVFVSSLIVVALAPLDAGTGWAGMAGTTISSLLDLAIIPVVLFTLVERLVCGFRPLQPKTCSIYQVDFWRHERYWKVPSIAYLRVFNGTPFKGLIWRLLGVRTGRRVFDDGCFIVERTLVSLGDDVTLNLASVLHGHSMEDGVFKSGPIAIASGCTLGTGAFVHYATVMEEDSLLDADSFLMKGSRISTGERWCGNPAMEAA